MAKPCLTIEPLSPTVDPEDERSRLPTLDSMFDAESLRDFSGDRVTPRVSREGLRPFAQIAEDVVASHDAAADAADAVRARALQLVWPARPSWTNECVFW